MRTPTRTDLVEDHERKIQTLKNQAMDLITTARHFGSLADSVMGIPSEGGQWYIDARLDVANFARQRQEACATRAKVFLAEANRLEQEGFRE